MSGARAPGATPDVGGFCLPLFHALDCADVVVIDGVELMPQYRELNAERRLIRLANEQDLTVADQEVRIVHGAATFSDVDGHRHQVRFVVECAFSFEDAEPASLS